MRKMRMLCGILAFLFIFPIIASASVLGEEIDGYTVQVAEGTYFTHKAFYSDQTGVGRQTENYAVYTPNEKVVPVISYGEYLYGGSKTSQEMETLISQGKFPVIGANADFFSFQTGVPMSNLVIDREIITKDLSEQYGIGFLEDGTAFMAPFVIHSVMTREDGSQTEIQNINKYRQPYAIYLLTDKFSTETRNTTKGIDVLLSVEEGKMAVGEKISAVVESVAENTGSVEIPEGKIMLTVDSNAAEGLVLPLSTLSVGEKIEISFDITGDDRWKKAKLGMGSVGGKLLEAGEINPELEKGVAPRTALGITEKGEIVLYSVDGRRTGHSYGINLNSLATRMKELGCVDAINLDGGGSTTFMVALPGKDIEIVNVPSDGSERNVSTFFYFENKTKPTGVAHTLHIYPKTAYVLKGASVQLEVVAADKNYHPAEIKEKVTYLVDKNSKSKVTQSGVFTAGEEGPVNVYAQSGKLKAHLAINCLETPTDIRVSLKKGGSAVYEIKAKRGETLDLSATAYGGQNELIAEDNLFTWSVSKNIGTITQNGEFTAADTYGKKGTLTISAGEKMVEIPVELVANGKETDEGQRPEISAEIVDGKVKGKISTGYNIDIKNVSVKVDGEEKEVSFKNGEFSAEIDEKSHKITILATSISGHASVKYLYNTELGSTTNPFADTNGNWAKDILSYMQKQGLINGENTEVGLIFRPQKEMSRAEFAVMCGNYLKIDEEKYIEKELPFADAESVPNWAKAKMIALYEMGIFKGRATDEGEVFADPMTTITRAEAATIISRILPDGLGKAEISSLDKDDIPDWAKDGMETLFETGAIRGYEDGSIRPLGKLTKAEAAKIFYSII